MVMLQKSGKNSPVDMGVEPKIGKHPKMDGLYKEHRIKMDDLGVPPFQETAIW